MERKHTGLKIAGSGVLANIALLGSVEAAKFVGFNEEIQSVKTEVIAVHLLLRWSSCNWCNKNVFR